MEIVPAATRGGRWGLTWAYLSAHRGEEWGFDSSETIRGGNMETDGLGVNRPSGREWKHANYSTQSKCNRGANGWDTCANNNVTSRFNVYFTDGNLGQINNRTFPSPSCAVPSRGTSSRLECYWSPGRFLGWQAWDGKGATGYHDILSDFGFTGTRAHIDG